ncbi:hypothetical protein RJ639_017182, partial [Escallonia herrerae]
MDVEIKQGCDALISKKAKHTEDAITKDLGNSSSIAGSTSGSINSDNINASNSDLSYHDDDNDDDDHVDDGDDLSDYGDDDDYIFENDDDNDDDYLNMQAQFDNVDLPPGVEASVSWLKEPMPCENVPTATSTSVQPDAVGLPAVAVVGGGAAAGTSASEVACVASCKKDVASSSSNVPVELCSDGTEEDKELEVMRRFQEFKKFDTVDDFSDHHYNCMGFEGRQPPKNWTKKIEDEWKILEKDLPDTIYVRVSESRMDLLRAVIVGPAGTPYHDGLFVFDVHFPLAYPDIPPMVYYYSGGLRLNPNLYDCGKVCLSLLNTWTGHGCEKWMPKSSTMLQVLVSIQALILNAKPFFNEPGHESNYTGDVGDKKSNAYNEDVFILSLKTMMYTLRRPPKHFEDLVAGHFRSRAHDILSACKAYMVGAEVGSAARGSSSGEFKAAISGMMNALVSNFTRNGAKNCEQFASQVTAENLIPNWHGKADFGTDALH